MMKRKIIYISIVCIAFVIGFLGFKQINTQEIRMDTKERLYSLEELEELSSAIVKVSSIKEKSTYIKFDDDKIPSEWKTYTNVIVDKVYNSKDGTIKKGDSIKIAEWYAEWRDLMGSYRVFSNEQYTPLVDNRAYVLFLYQEPGKDYYEIIGIHQGKYSFEKAIGNNGALKTDLKSLEINEPDPYYTEKFKKVFDKYK